MEKKTQRLTENVEGTTEIKRMGCLANSFKDKE